MSIQKSMKWLAMAGVGFLVSGCVAAQAPYAPGNVGYSDTAPGTFVADPSYAGGGYYEVVEAYDAPYYDPYYYGPSYGTVSTSILFHSHGSLRHRHANKHKSHPHTRKSTPKRKKLVTKSERKDKRIAKRQGLTAEERKVLAQERRDARQERRDTRQAACQEAGFENCKAQRVAERVEKRAAKQEAALSAAKPNKNLRIRPANKRKRRKLLK